MELGKLALTARPGAHIDADEVARGVSFQREQAMWEMTNALAAGNPAEALCRWRKSCGAGRLHRVSRRHLAVHVAGKRPQGFGNETQRHEHLRHRSALRIWPKENQEPFMKTATSLGEAGVARAVDLLAEIDSAANRGWRGEGQMSNGFILSMASQSA